MTAYVPIPNGDIDQDSPVTQPLMTALRDNLLATAEGSPGAPKIAKNVSLGSGATVTFTGLDAFSGLVADMIIVGNTSGLSGGLEISVSDNGTTFYGTIPSVFQADTTDWTGHGKFWLNFATGNYGLMRWQSTATAVRSSTGTITGASLNIVAIRFTCTGTGGSVHVSLEPNGGVL